MRPNTMPKLAFQRQSLVGEDHWHSALISVLRGIAAIEVAAAHLRALMYPGLRKMTDNSLWFQGFAILTGIAHQAVLVCFVISGWLVGGSLLNKLGQREMLVNYAIDRVTRLWTVLIPTFVLTLLFAVYTNTVTSTGIDYSSANEYSAVSFVGNLFGLQRIVLPDFGGNFALWSLTNETWYYIMFPMLALLFTARGIATRGGCLVALVLLTVWIPTAIMLYFTIWLLGVAFSRVRIECGKGGRLALLLLLAAVSVYFRIQGDNDDFTVDTFVQDFVFSLAFAIFLSSMQFKADVNSVLFRFTSRYGKFFADFSFSLYVMHLPLTFLLQYWSASIGIKQLDPALPLHFALFLGGLAFVLAGSYASYLLFEAQTYRVRRLLKQLVTGRGERRPAAASKVPVEH
ncbi:MAG: acyltransferase [Telluria sp.]